MECYITQVRDNHIIFFHIYTYVCIYIRMCAYIYFCIPAHGKFKGFDWGIPQWFGSYTPVVSSYIPVRKFKALQPIIKKCVNTIIVAHMKANMKAGIQASYITLHS